MVIFLRNMSRPVKRLLFLIYDTLSILVALFGAFALRYGELDPREKIGESWILFPIMLVLGAVLIHFFRLPKIKLNAFENRAILQVGLTAFSLAVSAIVISYLLTLSSPRSVPVVFGTLFFLIVAFGRLGGLFVLNYFEELAGERAPVIIYGAGSAGIQMASALRQSREAKPVAFVDDSTTLQGLMIAGLPVKRARELPELIKRFGVEQVLVAIHSIGEDRRTEFLGNLESLPVKVLVVPSYIDMMNGSTPLDKFRPVSPDKLLGRSKVELNAPEIARTYENTVVLVTGAGGSIGSELCRQLLNCSPAQIVLYEQNEFQLYSIDNELRQFATNTDVLITTYLGSVLDQDRLTSVIKEQNVDIILHAAAYKHVPLVESNQLEGIRNNVFGTKTVAEVAVANDVNRVILVSTDKAVRPTNVMGATKRMAELVVQDIQTRSDKTKFAMVRFGNVLGSSGSVLPLFQSQILSGGPVTVTHPEVTRFFMTIPEATRLVLLAGAYARGGDVFVLDMGKPQKIIDIARQMIELSGHQVFDPETGNGDIQIKITGLRPGEKLYEELLIDDASLVGTPHPKILRAEEQSLSQKEISVMLDELNACLKAQNSEQTHEILSKWVAGYTHNNSTAT